jgi:hypothetical protein
MVLVLLVLVLALLIGIPWRQIIDITIQMSKLRISTQGAPSPYASE